MEDWNVVVTANEKGFKKACSFLERFGRVKATSYFNVLTLHVPDQALFLNELDRSVGARAARGQ